MMKAKLQNLLQAIDKCDLELIGAALDDGVSVNDVTVSGCTPLMFAVMPDEYEDYTAPHAIESVVDYLLGTGADKSMIDDNGKTAFDYACLQLDPTWRGASGGNPSRSWSRMDVAILERIKSKLEVEQDL